MPINAACPKCQHTISVRSEFAGKKIKCPKCEAVIQLPGGVPAQVGASAGAGAARSSAATGPRQRHNPLLDLLDSTGVEAAPVGQTCPNCGKDIAPGNVLCMDCGYHLGLGKQMETAVMIDEGDLPDDDGRSDAEKRMAKAEREVDENPIGEFGVDFGEGKESFLIALVAVAALVVFVGAGIAIISSFEFITRYISSQMISLIASSVLAVTSAAWITTFAFRVKPVQGMICVFSVFLYCVPFGFMQGKTLLLPAVMLLASVLIGSASAYFVMYPPEADDSALMILRMASTMMTGRPLV
jgi:zinc-ribbon domain